MHTLSHSPARLGRPGFARTQSQWLLVLVTALLLSLHVTPVAMAFPFARTSGVTELTPATLPTFVNTHKPVVVLFYAPWCGHCKQFHSEYERFAQSVKGAIRVGAINADQHSEVGGQFGIRGFPTIKYWKAGSKLLTSPEEYQSQRTAKALQAFLMAGVPSDKVRTNVRTEASLKEVVLAAPKQKAAVLFSAKNRVPPIFSILALSPKLQELPFIFVEQKDGAGAGVAASFGIASLPTIAVVEAKPASEGNPGQPQFSATSYTGGEIAYEPVAKFFLAAVEGDTPGTSAAATDLDADGDQLDAQQQQQQQQKRKARQALPVHPVAFDVDETLPAFCAPSSGVTRLNGGVAWCVIALSAQADLAKVHALYEHEPFLFFDASSVGARAVEAALQEHLNGLTLAESGVDIRANAQDGLVLLRKTKPNLLRVVGFGGVDSTEALEATMEKVSSGTAVAKRWKLE